MRFVAMLSAALLTQTPTTPVAPPQIKHTEPIRFSYKELPISKWSDETPEKSKIWFKMDKGGWYVNWDVGRDPFTRIVIHHSAGNKDATADEIDKIQKERLYAPRYKSASKQPFVQGLPVHSGHMVNGKEKFLSYHHLVYHDGKVTTELLPLKKVDGRWVIDHVGWHAGNWDVNCESVAVCLVGDFTKEPPPQKQLDATASLLAYYKTLKKDITITGHNAHTATECPGKTWPLWKAKIMPH